MKELLSKLPAAGNYSIQVDRTHGSKVKLFAPHAGCIEPGTGPVVRALASDKFDCYMFNGIRRKDCFKMLHVTSSRYDEPHGMEMAKQSELAVAVHGCSGDEPFMLIGGGNAALASELARHMNGLGYQIRNPPGELKGEQSENLVNLARQQGIQIELSAGLRTELFPGLPKTQERDPVAFPRFIEGLKEWLVKTERSFGGSAG